MLGKDLNLVRDQGSELRAQGSGIGDQSLEIGKSFSNLDIKVPCG
jgi:hypothetical protein